MSIINSNKACSIINKNISECRSCKLKNLITEMQFLFDDDDFAEIFMECTSLNVDQSDGLPSYICTYCKQLLTNYQKFRLMCADSDAYFREKINIKIETSTSDLPEGIKIEQLLYVNTGTNPDRSENGSEVDELTVQNGQSTKYINNLYQIYVKYCLFVDAKQQHYEITNTTIPIDNIPNQSISITTDTETRHNHSLKESVNIYRNYAVNNKKLICDLCQKIFFKKHHLENHLRQHLDLKTVKKVQKFSCDYEGCSKTYTAKKSLNRHIKNSHCLVRSPAKRNFICEQCGKSFKTNGHLKEHIYIHTGDMPFKCNLCPKKYASHHKLKEHLMRHEGIKNHICSICGMGKTTAHELKTHMNYHTREKLHYCKICSAVFISTGNMSKHIKIVHCGVKSYHCTHCDKSFGKAETLKHHIMTHTGEKPHICDVCNKRFIQLVALQTHKKIHNK